LVNIDEVMWLGITGRTYLWYCTMLTRASKETLLVAKELPVAGREVLIE
jgi:hypothetical protein